MIKLFGKKNFLGVDIGTYSIKLAEISKKDKKTKLENYGEILASSINRTTFRAFKKSSLIISIPEVGNAIKTVCQEAGIETKKSVFTLPDFMTFFTSFDLPKMSTSELTQAVEYEAKRHVPVPLADLTLDWEIVKNGTADKNKQKISLVAVPNKVINQYQEIAKAAELELVALESEVFALIRALRNDDINEPLAFLDIGSQSTTVNIARRHIVESSHSFDVAGSTLTSALVKGMELDYVEAEEIKRNNGLRFNGEERQKKIRDILVFYIDDIIKETEKSCSDYEVESGMKIDKIILSGGVARMPGLKEYFSKNLNKDVSIANPFFNLDYDPKLKNYLTKRGPSVSIAIGAALRGLL